MKKLLWFAVALAVISVGLTVGGHDRGTISHAGDQDSVQTSWEASDVSLAQGLVSYAAATVHRRDAWTPTLGINQSIVFEGPLTFDLQFGEFNPDGTIPIMMPQASWEWESKFVEGEGLSFTIDILAVGNGTGVLYTEPGAAIDYIVTTTVDGMGSAEFTGSGPAGSALLITPMQVSVWLNRDYTDGNGGIDPAAPDPDVEFAFTSYDTTGTATTAIDTTGCPADVCAPGDDERVKTGVGSPFESPVPGGSFKMVRALALLGIPWVFGTVNLQVMGDFQASTVVGGDVVVGILDAPPADASDSASSRDYTAPIAATVVAGVLALTASGWYARRHWLR
jgi:hypothetical protein